MNLLINWYFNHFFQNLLRFDEIFESLCSVLITSSLKFRSMLNSKFCEGSPPILQINDIRYEIFDTVKNVNDWNIFEPNENYLCRSCNTSTKAPLKSFVLSLQMFLSLWLLLIFSSLTDCYSIVKYDVQASLIWIASSLIIFMPRFVFKHKNKLLTYIPFSRFTLPSTCLLTARGLLFKTWLLSSPMMIPSRDSSLVRSCRIMMWSQVSWRLYKREWGGKCQVKLKNILYKWEKLKLFLTCLRLCLCQVFIHK